MYSLCFKPYTNYTQKPTLKRSNSTQQPYTKGSANPTFCFLTRISRLEFRTRMERMEQMNRMEFRTRMKRMEQIVRNVCNVRNEERNERKTGNGNRRWRASSLPPSLPLFDSLSLPISFPPPRHSFPPPRHSFPPPRHSCKPPKIQQFWAIFQRFDINIFNLSEHFPPPNFAYSACSFALPSPN